MLPLSESTMSASLSIVVSVITILVSWGAVAGAYSMFKEKILQLEKDRDECRKHSQNTQIHADPIRDERRWAQIEEWLRRIETKVERLLNGQTHVD